MKSSSEKFVACSFTKDGSMESQQQQRTDQKFYKNSSNQEPSERMDQQWRSGSSYRIRLQSVFRVLFAFFAFIDRDSGGDGMVCVFTGSLLESILTVI